MGHKEGPTGTIPLKIAVKSPDYTLQRTTLL